jgi:hypothetical protein
VSDNIRVMGTAGGTLGALRGSTKFPHLDSHLCAQQVRALLAQLPPPTLTPTLAHSPQ